MIVTKMQMEFGNAGWAAGERISEGVRHVFEKITKREEAHADDEQSLTRMSLSSLLYYALLGEGAIS